MNRYVVTLRSGEEKTVEAHLLTTGEVWVVFYAGPGSEQALARTAVAAFPTGEVLSVTRTQGD